MKKLISSITLSLSLLASNANADNYPERDPIDTDDKLGERAIVMGTNVALGGLAGCIGAEASGDGCLEGLWRGSLGGFVTFMGMEIGSFNAKVPFTGLLGRGIADLGSSILSNTMFSRDFLERYETSIGPALFSFDRNEGFNLYIQPVALGLAGYHILSGHKILLEDSLQDGTLAFRLNELTPDKSGGLPFAGYTASTIPAYANDSTVVRSHENIHTYQMSSVRWADEVVPNVWRFRYGAEALLLLLNAPSDLIGGDFYNYAPAELEAYAMERR